MPRELKITDDQLRDFLEKGLPQSQIAAVCKVSEGTVSKRIKAMEQKAARFALATVPEHATRAMASVWDTKNALDENYRRVLDLLNNESNSPGDNLRAVSEIRQHMQFAMQVLETLYNVQESQAFMEEVLQVLDECEPSAREKILTRLREKRSVRAAFFQN